MVHVFRLGPIHINGHPAFVYAGFDERGALQPEVAHTDADGLRALAAAVEGQPLRCEPSLAKAGRPLGFEPAPLPEKALLLRATLAYGLGLGAGSGPPDPDVLIRFLVACATFWHARPWELFDSGDPLPVTLTLDGRARTGEASVLGGGGQEFGVALYDEPGSIQRIARLVDEGRIKESRCFSALAVTFDAEPKWAASAIEDAFGLPRLPVPLRAKGGKASLASTEDLLAAAALLEAVADLAGPEDADDAEATVKAGDRTATAHVALLEDTGHGGDDVEPELVPAPTAAPSRARTPRNAPCPCGSGRKYKKCHLAEDEARSVAARGDGPTAPAAREEERRLAERDPIHALDERLTADALALARRRWGRGFDPEGALRRLGLDELGMQYLTGWSSCHHPGPDGRTALDLYVEERGGALDAEGRAWIEAQRAASFSYMEVVSADPGRSMTLRDLLAGSERTVQEKSASRVVRSRDVLLTRVVDLGDRAFLAGCHPRALPPRAGDEARRRLRSALRVRAAKVPPAKLRQATADGTLFRIWQEIVAEIDAQPLPRLQNTDGEDLLLTVDRFDLAAGAAAEARARLLELPGAREEKGEPGSSTSIAFSKPGNARTAMLPTTLIGRAVLDGGAMKLETNSVKRADGLRRLVEERLGSLIAFRIREHTDPVANLGGEGWSPRPAEPPPPEVSALLRKLQAEHYRRWLDESIPALGGLTPREAARRTGEPRRKLELLLAEIEHGEAQRSKAERFDVAALRRQMGCPTP